MRQHRRAGEQAAGHLVAEDILRRRRRSLVRHVGHLEARHRLQQFHRQVPRHAGAARRIAHLLGLGLGDELGDGLDPDRRIAHQGLVELGGDRHRHQVVHLERHLLVDMRIHRDQRIGTEQPGVAVGRGARDLGGAEVAAGAGLVVDDDRLLQRDLHLLGRLAHDDVARPAGRKRQHDANRPLRPGTGLRRDGNDDADRGQRDERGGAKGGKASGASVSPEASRGGGPDVESSSVGPACGAERRRRHAACSSSPRSRRARARSPRRCADARPAPWPPRG